jgi:hypothetical protein
MSTEAKLANKPSFAPGAKATTVVASENWFVGSTS